MQTPHLLSEYAGVVVFACVVTLLGHHKLKLNLKTNELIVLSNITLKIVHLIFANQKYLQRLL